MRYSSQKTKLQQRPSSGWQNTQTRASALAAEMIDAWLATGSIGALVELTIAAFYPNADPEALGEICHAMITPIEAAITAGRDPEIDALRDRFIAEMRGFDGLDSKLSLRERRLALT